MTGMKGDGRARGMCLHTTLPLWKDGCDDLRASYMGAGIQSRKDCCRAERMADTIFLKHVLSDEASFCCLWQWRGRLVSNATAR